MLADNWGCPEIPITYSVTIVLFQLNFGDIYSSSRNVYHLGKFHNSFQVFFYKFISLHDNVEWRKSTYFAYWSVMSCSRKKKQNSRCKLLHAFLFAFSKKLIPKNALLFIWFLIQCFKLVKNVFFQSFCLSYYCNDYDSCTR